MGYVGLHHHTTYSFLEAIGLVKNHVHRVSELGLSAIAITDYMGLYGAMDLYKSIQDYGLKPLIGVDMPRVRDLSLGEPRSRGYITFLARDVSGYHTLLRLVSAAYMRREPGQIPFVDLSLLREDHEGVLVFFGGPQSRYGTSVLTGEPQKQIDDQVVSLVDIMGADSVYGEVVAQNYSLLPDIQKVNESLLSMANRLDLEVFVSNNVHYIHADDRESLEVAHAIKDNKKIYDEDRRKTIGEYHIVDGEWIQQMMQRNGYDSSTVSQWIDQTQIIADSIDIHIDMGKTLFPNYEVSDEIEELYKTEKERLVVE